MHLVLVHGRAQEGQNPAELQNSWEEALARGWEKAGLSKPENLTVSFPYYGDILAEMVEAAKAPKPADVLTRGGEMDQRELVFMRETLEELAKNAAEAGMDESALEAQMADEVLARGPQEWEWVQGLLRLLDNTWISRRVIESVTRDVFVYLTRKPVRKKINRIIEAEIKGRRAVVVAHSLGSVVSFDVLRHLGAGTNVPRFITLGSPLGIGTIKRYLSPPPLAMPGVVREWFNGFDNRDVVALRPLNQSSFRINPPITNKADVNNPTPMRHGIEGYLADAEVASWIQRALTA